MNSTRYRSKILTDAILSNADTIPEGILKLPFDKPCLNII